MATLFDGVEGVVVIEAFFKAGHEDLGDVAEKDFAIASEHNAARLDVRPCHHFTGFF